MGNGLDVEAGLLNWNGVGGLQLEYDSRIWNSGVVGIRRWIDVGINLLQQCGVLLDVSHVSFLECNQKCGKQHGTALGSDIRLAI